MKKRLQVFLLVCLLLMGLSVSAASAQNNWGGVLDMAQYFPQGTAIFAAFTVPDSAYLDELDSFNQGMDVSPQLELPPGAPTTPREMLNQQLRPFGVDIDTLLGWLGDYGALGVGNLTSNGQAENVSIRVQITDRDSVEQFIDLLTKLPDADFVRGSQDGYTLYLSQDGSNAHLAINDEWLIAYQDKTGGAPVLPMGAALTDNAAFQTTMATFPGDGYSNVLYVDWPALLKIADLSTMPPGIDLSPETVGPWALASTFIGGETILVDSVQMPGANGEPVTVKAIDPDFARFVPKDASFVVHATDLTGLFENLLGTITALSPDSGGEDPRASLEQALAMLSIDLQDDLLSWTTGDYALFLRADIVPIMQALVQERIDINGRLDYGLVIEATDPAKAADFAKRLGNILRMMTAQVEEVTVSDETMQGVEVTVFSTSTFIEGSGMLALDVVVGASDGVFFVASRAAAESILSGDGGLAANTTYNEAQKYLLANPTSVWYGDSNGMVVGVAVPTIGVLTMLGPAIGNVFENIVDELDSPSQSSYNPPKAQFVAQTDPTVQYLRQMEMALDMLHSFTVSSTVTADGATLIRLAIIYNR